MTKEQRDGIDRIGELEEMALQRFVSKAFGEGLDLMRYMTREERAEYDLCDML